MRRRRGGGAVVIPPPPLAGKYQTLVVDPPWGVFSGRLHEVRGDTPPYAMMSLADIEALPVAEWAAEDAMVFLWVLTSKLGDKTRAVQVGDPSVCIMEAGFGLLRAWGFQYSQTLTWIKSAPGNPTFTPWLPITEHILVGWRGNFRNCYLQSATGRIRTALYGPNRAGHSAKPAEIYNLIADNFHGPRLEVFARDSRPGFDGWGDQYHPDNGKGRLYGGK